MVLQIREFSTGGTFDDQADIDIPSLPFIKPALPQLSPDPAQWLPPKARQGLRSTLNFSSGALHDLVLLHVDQTADCNDGRHIHCAVVSRVGNVQGAL